MFGDVDKVYKDDVYNAILLSIKYYIYTNRCLKQKLSFHSLKACVINLYKTEKMILSEIKELQNFNYIGVLLKNCLRIVDIFFILM